MNYQKTQMVTLLPQRARNPTLPVLVLLVFSYALSKACVASASCAERIATPLSLLIGSQGLFGLKSTYEAHGVSYETFLFYNTHIVIVLLLSLIMIGWRLYVEFSSSQRTQFGTVAVKVTVFGLLLSIFCWRVMEFRNNAVYTLSHRYPIAVNAGIISALGWLTYWTLSELICQGLALFNRERRKAIEPSP